MIPGRPNARRRRLDNRRDRFFAVWRNVGDRIGRQRELAVNPKPARRPRTQEKFVLPRLKLDVRGHPDQERCAPAFADSPLVVAQRNARQNHRIAGPTCGLD